MGTKYLDEAGLKIVWDKTKEMVKAVDDKTAANAGNIEEVNAKIDEIQSLPLEELNEMLVDTIKFSISRDDGEYFTECQAIKGMTWAEFVNSEYNNGVVYIDDKSGVVRYNAKGGATVYLNGEYVYGVEVIENNAEYLVYNV